MIAAISPLYVNEQFVGNFGHDILLESMIQRLQYDKINDVSFAIVDAHGKLITHTDLFDELKKSPESFYRENTKDIEISYLYNAVKQLENGNSISIFENISDKNILIVSKMEGPDWYYITIYPKENFFNTTQKIIWIFLVMAIFMFLIQLFLVSSMIKKNIIKPLSNIANVLKEYKTGEIVTLKEAKCDNEIGVVSRSFMNMTKRINQYANNLKDEVEKNKKKDLLMLQHSRMAQMGEMISMIAHQWRQPLSSISAITINLQMQMELEKFDLKQEEERKAFLLYLNSSLKNIDELLKSLSETISDFRNFYKPNKLIDLVDFYEPVAKALSIIRASLESDNIEIVELVSTCKSKKSKIYSNEMMQVVLNILKNAQDNFKENQIAKPKLTIDCNCSDEMMVLKISDNGGGIPEHILPEIFNPYFSTKDEKNGTGLGLYMSKIIVEKHHNGKLTATNTEDGVCFTIKLNSAEIAQ